MTDEYYMKRALRLARRGESGVSPNPMVGAVIVKDDHIIGEGYHRRFGGPHGEIDALGRCRESVAGATIYVTLEPCSHHGKTPPCTEALISRQPARVVIGVRDPNPRVSGKGVEILENAGISVTLGVLEEECRDLNERFFKFVTTGLPYVTLKFAQTLDGRIATTCGHSRWISTPAARKFAHRLRSVHDAILVGSGTVRLDDPELTVRHVKGRNPLRIVVDSRLSLPEEAKVFAMEDGAGVIVATANRPDRSNRADREKMHRLREKGVEILFLSDEKNESVDLKKLFRELGKRQISSVLVEGGSAIITSLLKERLADRLVVIIAPRILGRGIEAVGALGISRMDETITLSRLQIKRTNGDIILDGRPVWPSGFPQP